VKRPLRPPPMPTVYVLAVAPVMGPDGDLGGARVAGMTFSRKTAEAWMELAATAYPAAAVMLISLCPFLGWDVEFFRPGAAAPGAPTVQAGESLANAYCVRAMDEGWHYVHQYPGSDYIPGSSSVAEYAPCPLEELFRE
jgi:hypothetical protein